MTDNRQRCEYCGAVMHRGIHYGAMVACLRIRALLMTIAGFDTPASMAAIKHFEAEFNRGTNQNDR